MRSTTVIRRALVFAGQGSQKPGMGLDLMTQIGYSTIWNGVSESLKAAKGFDLTHILKENPKELELKGEKVSYESGLLNRTDFTQPALLTFNTALLAHLAAASGVTPDPNKAQSYLPAGVTHIAGHSLGEFSALTAAGLFSAVDAATLVNIRGTFMLEAMEELKRLKRTFVCAAIGPQKAGLTTESTKELLTALSQVVTGTGFIESMNDNITDQQLIVAGDPRTMAAFGKALDAKHRAAVGGNDFAAVAKSVVELVQNDAQMEVGLKKSGAFFPLPLSAPFHTSVLRPATDNFHAEITRKLPSSAVIEECLSKVKYFPNLTGTPFCAEKGSEFRASVLHVLQTPNAGEAEGVPSPAVQPAMLAAAKDGDAKELLAAVLTAQLSRGVQWSKSVNAMLKDGVTELVEVCPMAPVLSPMFAKNAAQALLAAPATTAIPKELSKFKA